MSNSISGKVIAIDENGGLVTDIDSGQLSGAPHNDSTKISFGGHHTNGIFPDDHSEPEMTLMAILPESGPLRIELTGTSISEMLGIQVGESVEVSW